MYPFLALGSIAPGIRFTEYDPSLGNISLVVRARLAWYIDTNAHTTQMCMYAIRDRVNGGLGSKIKIDDSTLDQRVKSHQRFDHIHVSLRIYRVNSSSFSPVMSRDKDKDAFATPQVPRCPLMGWQDCKEAPVC
jgi:hypothetical protein